jgi:glycosyltransferase involved in cell wall biosynthesis
MFLSVIIPTYKRRETLIPCLKLLAPEKQNLSLDSYEVVVTDDALTDRLEEFLKSDFPWVVYNKGPQAGPAANRNSGANASRGDWLIFLDDDCLPQPTFLSAYAKAIQANPEYSVFEGSTLPERPKVRMDEEAPINENGGYLWSCNFLIKRSLFSEIGGFCEIYPYACMEDVDFREQLNLKKAPFLFVREASVIHPWRLLTSDIKYLKVRVISHAIFLERYPDRRPNFLGSCQSIFRGWLHGFILAPQLRFRGFGRFVSRMATVTIYHFVNWFGLSRRLYRS